MAWSKKYIESLDIGNCKICKNKLDHDFKYSLRNNLKPTKLKSEIAANENGKVPTICQTCFTEKFGFVKCGWSKEIKKFVYEWNNEEIAKSNSNYGYTLKKV
jgi:hypothetical protein